MVQVAVACSVRYRDDLYERYKILDHEIKKLSAALCAARSHPGMHHLDRSEDADLREDPKNEKPTELSSELNHKKKEKDEIMCYLSAMFPLPKPTSTSIVVPPRLKTASLNSSALVDPVWAVVIGINKYAHAQWLDGAVKDACAVREFLLHFLHVPEDHIALLLDRNATRETIITTLHDHLLNNPTIQRGDAIIIYFAGHGARYVNDHGSSHEAIVPADRGKMLSADGLDIVEDICEHELHSFLKQPCDTEGYNITLILDCCYSGGCSRGGPAATRAVRSAAPLHHPPHDSTSAPLNVSASVVSIVSQETMIGSVT